MGKKQLFYWWAFLLFPMLTGCYGDVWNINYETGFKVQSISLDKSSLDLREGDTCTLNVLIDPSFATVKELTWHSSDTVVVKVDSSGKITALKLGEAVVTAVADMDLSAECAVFVRGKISGEIESSPAGGGNGTGEIEW